MARSHRRGSQDNRAAIKEERFGCAPHDSRETHEKAPLFRRGFLVSFSADASANNRHLPQRTQQGQPTTEVRAWLLSTFYRPVSRRARG